MTRRIGEDDVIVRQLVSEERQAGCIVCGTEHTVRLPSWGFIQFDDGSFPVCWGCTRRLGDEGTVDQLRRDGAAFESAMRQAFFDGLRGEPS